MLNACYYLILSNHPSKYERKKQIQKKTKTSFIRHSRKFSVLNLMIFILKLVGSNIYTQLTAKAIYFCKRWNHADTHSHLARTDKYLRRCTTVSKPVKIVNPGLTNCFCQKHDLLKEVIKILVAVCKIKFKK